MSTDELLSLVESRGLTLRVDAHGRLRLRGRDEAITARLLEVLRLPVHREAVLTSLLAGRTPQVSGAAVTSPVYQPSPPDRRRRECLFRFGNVVQEPEPWATPKGSVVWDWAAGWLPYGSLWERFLGETEWRPIPGRGGESLPLPGANVAPAEATP